MKPVRVFDQRPVGHAKPHHRFRLGAHVGEQRVDRRLFQRHRAAPAACARLHRRSAHRGSQAPNRRRHPAARRRGECRASAPAARRAAAPHRRTRSACGPRFPCRSPPHARAPHSPSSHRRFRRCRAPPPAPASTAARRSSSVTACSARAGSSAILPPAKRVRIDAAQHDIRIGHRWLIAAARIAGGAGIRARTVRPDDDAPQRIDARDRAAAGTDLHHVDDRNAHRKAAALGKAIGTRDLEMPRLLRRVSRRSA